MVIPTTMKFTSILSFVVLLAAGANAMPTANDALKARSAVLEREAAPESDIYHSTYKKRESDIYHATYKKREASPESDIYHATYKKREAAPESDIYHATYKKRESDLYHGTKKRRDAALVV
ncbi:hypothetical protein D6D28_01400 [Aureobasidium pullulans]|uniref:Uncharacterized protein n=1 Tax=Aureobasidium pullulans TaxID=5580 RepID=A0A4S8SXP3_AURPU|nr:hypothetical protein D6D28_01400 [Aureobasidium pullulans]